MGWVVWGYLAGVAVCCLRLVGMWAGMAGVKRGAADAALQEWARELAVRMGIGVVRVVESARVEVPVVVGILRPVVVVPMMAVTGLSEGELRALLAHEMAHIRRWDPVVNAVQCVVEAMLFYHPAVWWISRVIREERECCCDDVAAAVVGDRATYAGALAAMEGLRGVRGRLAIGARTGGLAGRVERLLGRRRELQGGRGWAVVT
jgi:beta-lactamase regulating signal transducer with metallopeptidase domain